MKKLTILLLLVLVSAFLLFSGCGKDKDDDDGDGGISGIPDITPANYDWDIYFMEYSEIEFKSLEYMVMADWLGESSAISESDVFTLDINGESHEFMSHFMFDEWYISAMVELEPGAEYAMVFKKNGNTVASQTLKIPYNAAVSFPDSFDPTNAATMNWNMAGNNKYQVVSLSSTGEGFDDDDDWEKVIDVSARTFTFPANAVEDFGPDTEYDMILAQMNFEKSGRVAFSSFSFAVEMYGEGEWTKLEPSKLRKIAKNIRQRIR